MYYIRLMGEGEKLGCSVDRYGKCDKGEGP